MRDRPADLTEEEVRTALGESWALQASSLVFSPVGAGSYHWVAIVRDGTRHFITVDDLDTKPWLGSDRESVFASLRRCYEAASKLRDGAGLDFIVAPVSGLARLSPRYSIAVLPFVDAEPLGLFDTPPESCAEIVRMMARLHGASYLVEGMAPRRPLAIPDRGELDAALNEVDHAWQSGPLAEDARRWLAENADGVRRGLREYDSLAKKVAAIATSVITHGEPHAGNFLRSPEKLWLVDWDTIAFAPPERDLWLCCAESNEHARLYAEQTLHEVDAAAIELFTIGWHLSDIASYLSQLRRAHTDSEDSRRALSVLRRLSAYRW